MPPKLKYPCDGERHAALCAHCFGSARHSATRRGLVWPSVNPWRAAARIATQMLAVGARSRGVLMHKQWLPF